MTFTYTGLDFSTDLAKVRLLIGDTVSPGDLTDEEIAYFLALYTTVGGAAIAAVRALIANFASVVDKAVGDLKISASQKFKHYTAMLPIIEASAAATDQTEMYAGGIQQSEEDDDDANTSITHPRFKIGMHDEDTPVDTLRSDV